MLSGLAADAVLLLHFAFILFVVFGGLLVLRRPRIAWVHLPAALWGAWVEFSGRICPLTPLENALRRAAGEAAYEGDFIARYLLPLIYPGDLTRPVQWALGGLVLLLNGVIYAMVIRSLRRRGK